MALIRAESILIACVIGFFVNTGCRSDAEHQIVSKTDLLRLSAHPGAVRYLNRARANYTQGNYGQAMAFVDSAVRYAPELPDVYFLKGLIFAEYYLSEEAEKAFLKVAEIDLLYPGLWFELGHIAFHRKKYRQAISFYNRELTAGESNRNPVVASNRSTVCLMIARAYTKVGEVDSACQIYEQAIALDSAYAEAFADLGALYQANGEYEKALTYSQRAVTLQKDNIDYHYIHGTNLFKIGNARQAAIHLRKVANARPWFPGAIYNLSKALSRLGRKKESQFYLSRLERVSGLNDKINRALINVKTYPWEPLRWTEYARALSQAGRLEESMKAYKKALSYAPSDSSIQSKITELELRLAARSEANSIKQR